MFAVVTSANVACGFHAGDPLTMAESVGRAARHGVALGAHPGYRDLVGFGRRALDTSPAELAAELLAQLGALDGIARGSGMRVRYVKAHGALYHRLGVDEPAAHAFAEADRPLRPDPARARPAVERDSSGQRMPRASASPARPSSTGATSPTARSCPAASPARSSTIPRRPPSARSSSPRRAASPPTTAAASSSPPTRSACTATPPGAVAIARAVRAALEAAGIEIRAFA